PSSPAYGLGTCSPPRLPCVGGHHSTAQAPSVVGRRHVLPTAGRVTSRGLSGLVPPAPAGDVGGLRLAGDVPNVSMVLRRSRIGGFASPRLFGAAGATTLPSPPLRGA